MAREAKHALCFLGILLLVFGGLLWKHLKSPEAGFHLFAQSAPKAAEAAPTVRPPLPTQPTLVTPRGENDRPPELAVAGAGSGNDRYSSSPLDDSSRKSAANWSRRNAGEGSTGYGSTGSDSASSSSAGTPPSLLSNRLPISVVGDRYAARAQQDAIEQTNPEQNALPLAATDSSTARSYRSAYPTTSDDKPAPGSPVTHTPIEIPVAAPPVAQSTLPPSNVSSRDYPSAAYGSADPRYNTGLKRLEPAPPQYDTQPVAGITNVTPRAAPPSPGGYSATSSAFPQPNNRYALAPPNSAGNSWPAQSPQISQSYGTPVSPSVDPRAANNTTGSAVGLYGDASGATPASPREGNQYTVAPNDSFWIISQKTYGTGAYFKALYEHNRKRMKDPNDLKVGQILSVPDEATIRRLYPDLCPKPRKADAGSQQRMMAASARAGSTGRVYTVSEGDTLFEIARHELGKPSRWAEIYQLNHDVLGDDFDYLRTGTQLIMPADAAAPVGPAYRADPARGNTATRPPEAFYPR